MGWPVPRHPVSSNTVRWMRVASANAECDVCCQQDGVIAGAAHREPHLRDTVSDDDRAGVVCGMEPPAFQQQAQVVDPIAGSPR